MKSTLLDLTQNILSRMSSDEVNSIGDNTESLQVANIIKNTYFNIIARTDLPEHREIFQLVASTDSEIPVTMYRPEHVCKIDWIKYFKEEDDDSTGESFQHDLNVDITLDGGSTSPAPSFTYVTILPIEQFLDMVNTFNTDNSNVETYTYNEFTLRYKTDKNPQYCTVLKDFTILFDSYNNDVDSTLQSSKTMCFGQTVPTFTMSDSFIPDLDEQQFPLLLNEATSLAFFELKQMEHPKAEQENKRQWSVVQRNKALVDRPSSFNALPNFGRSPGSGGYGSSGHSSYRWMRGS